MVKRLHLYAYCFQKWVHIEQILMKLKIWGFLIKNDELLEKYNEVRDKVSNSIKKGF